MGVPRRSFSAIYWPPLELQDPGQEAGQFPGGRIIPRGAGISGTVSVERGALVN